MGQNNIIDFQGAKLKETIKNVCKRNGMGEADLAKVNKIDNSVLEKIALNNFKLLGKMTLNFLEEFDKFQKVQLEPRHNAIFAYAMFEFVKHVLESDIETNPSDELATSLKVLDEYMEECKYLFVETNILFDMLDFISFKESVNVTKS